MIKISKYKIANYLSDEKGYAYKVAIDVAKDIEDYINDKTEEVQKETAQKFLQLWYDDMFNAGECVGHIEKLAKEMGVKIAAFGVEVEE